MSSQPEFIEEGIFKTIIPLKVEKQMGGYSVNDAVNDAISDAVKERLGKELVFIIENNGIQLLPCEELLLKDLLLNLS